MCQVLVLDVSGQCHGESGAAAHFAFGGNASVEQLQHPAHQRVAKAVALFGVRTVPLIKFIKNMAQRLGIHAAASVSDLHRDSFCIRKLPNTDFSTRFRELDGVRQQIVPY